MNDYYQKQLAAGQEYQDFIADQLWDLRKWRVQNYTSARYQLTKGENSQGLEIKHDTLMKKTGNLYIEISECADPYHPHFPSGIYAGHSICYLIGDYERAFLFYTDLLQNIHRRQLYRTISIPRTTSRGFLLPIKDVRRMGWIIDEILFPPDDSKLSSKEPPILPSQPTPPA